GRLGQKSGAGFYRKGDRRVIEMIDPKSFEYIAQNRPEFPCLALTKKAPSVADRIRAVTASDDPGGRFIRANLASTIAYAAQCVPEICDDLPSIDDAMRWGFGWSLGPFELFDAMGADRVKQALHDEGRSIPPLLEALDRRGEATFYKRVGDERIVLDPIAERPAVVPRSPRRQTLRSSTHVADLDDARLVDLGEEVLGLEFTSKRNTITPGWIASARESVERAEREFRGLVISSDADDFCVGANLQLVVDAVEAGNFSEVERIVADFQSLTQRLRTSRCPVVVAPRGLALGGGCEIVLAGARVRAAAETYIGLVEVGAGLIPAGGGCTAMLRRLEERLPTDVPSDRFPFVRRLFETVGMARIGTSAVEAFELGYLRTGDSISMNRHHLIADARNVIVAMQLEGYRPERPRNDIQVVGRDGYYAIRSGLDNMKEGRQITEYDAVVGERLAWILCGGAISEPTAVSEDYLLALERQAFMDLCRDDRTVARMKQLLETGKPLRN
ncbi:MAG: enoyl-CoA hydratase/isomerase family protein, partial [Planctomycetes bacterium]|nr:enoyl-CoA hydratase/isomerase family protein [Planctomycetota bacterium]